MELIKAHKILWYESKLCTPSALPQIKAGVEAYLFPDNKKTPYWISFDIDGVDKSEFASTGTPEAQGISLDFMMKFFEAFLPESVGMDFTEVNFLRGNEEQVEIDMLTVRLIIEKIV